MDSTKQYIILKLKVHVIYFNVLQIKIIKVEPWFS